MALEYKANCKNCGNDTGVRVNFKLNQRIFECKKCYFSGKLKHD